MRRHALVTVLAAALVMAGCDSPKAGPSPSASTGEPVVTGIRSCEGTPGFHCGTLRVPLDHSGRAPGSLDLRVAMADNASAPRGVLLVLSGGPGQPGVSLVNRLQRYFDPAVLRDYRMVMFDQRGTGPAGINCAPLQTAVGGSDFLTPPTAAVSECASQLGGARDYYGTPDTVQDIELLRRALGASQLTVDGVSYGTFTGAHYALRYPDRVKSLVLDSIVPFRGFDPFAVDEMAATRRVLADACGNDSSCTTDPVADLAWLIRNGFDGVDFLESLSVLSLSSVNPAFQGIPKLLHDARAGDTQPLKELFQQASSLRTSYSDLSAGLHLATFCSDLRFPWGTSAAPLRDRGAALDKALQRLRAEDLYPYDVKTARSTLAVQGCLAWPPAKASAYAGSQRLTPRTLLLHGEHDLFCPLAWAEWERDHASNARLVVVPDNGHGLQGSRTDSTARNAVRDFLLG